MVTGLGEALHQAKLKLTGVKETPACAEGRFIKKGATFSVSYKTVLFSLNLADSTPTGYHPCGAFLIFA